LNKPESFSIQQLQLRGFSRSLAELEWLLLILVLFYFVAPGTEVADRFGFVSAMIAFAVFVLAFRYARFFSRETRGKLAVETWIMILFVSYVAYNTGGVHSPLLNLYLLVIITSALTLGKMVTFLEFILITAVYFYMGYPEFVSQSFSINDFSRLMILFAPYLLVGYVTTMLASDIHYGVEALESLSQTDELTGLRNRRAFNETLHHETRKASRYGRSYSILMMDVDDLKSINDRLGHDAGDKLLKMISNVIQDVLRDTDILARYGGDEFIVLLPETDSEQALEAAERIRTAVNNTSINLEGQAVSSTVSIGIAGYPGSSEEPHEVMKYADKALYQCKNKGKNSVVAFLKDT